MSAPTLSRSFTNLLQQIKHHHNLTRSIYTTALKQKQENYTEPKPWTNAYQRRNEQPNTTDNTTNKPIKDIKSDLVSKYNLLNPRGRQPLSVALEQDAELLNESRMRNFNAINEQEYTAADDARVAAEESENQSIVNIINAQPQIELQNVDLGLPKRPTGINRAIMPKSRRSVDNYTQQQSVGLLTELQLSRLCILYKYNSTVFSIENLADMFNIDSRQLYVILKHISIPYIYKHDNITYGSNTIIPNQNIEHVKVAGVDSVLTNEQIAMLRGVKMDDPTNLNSVFASLTPKQQQQAT